MPKASIEASIARGQGTSVSGEALESLTIEAMLPGSVAAIIECLTDNKARVLQDLRYIIKDYGGTVTPTMYLFQKKGRISFEKKEDLNFDDYLTQAIEAGATDIDTDREGRILVFTEAAETKAVGESFTKATRLIIERSEIIWDPRKDTMVKVESKEDIKNLEETLGAIRDDPSIRDIYLNSIEWF
jgi:transcriptional/translational regulatory protein YebC/TACO1